MNIRLLRHDSGVGWGTPRTNPSISNAFPNAYRLNFQKPSPSFVKHDIRNVVLERHDKNEKVRFCTSTFKSALQTTVVIDLVRAMRSKTHEMNKTKFQTRYV